MSKLEELQKKLDKRKKSRERQAKKSAWRYVTIHSILLDEAKKKQGINVGYHPYKVKML